MIFLLLAAACASPLRHDATFLPAHSWPVPLPRGYRAPAVSPSTPFTIARSELGRHLFYDVRLSANGTQSCASCHQQRYAFSDGRARAVGSTGEIHPRNSMGLVNVAYRETLTWGDRSMTSLEEQVLVPLTNTSPVEMGMKGRLPELLDRLRADATYRELFAAAFAGEHDPFTIGNVARALAAFERSIIAAGSRYDRVVRDGDSDAMSASEWRGMRLFFSDRLACSSCHGGADFATSRSGESFHDNGTFRRDDDDRGLEAKSRRRADRGRFRVPSLRNVGATAPYMHDGSVSSLREVIADYAAGGRAVRLGDRRRTDVRPFVITAGEIEDLLAFLHALTDHGVLADPRFADPWTSAPPRETSRGERGEVGSPAP